RFGKRVEIARRALGLGDQGADIGVTDAEVATDLDVVRPLVRLARQISDLQDGKLAQARVESALEADELAETAEGTRGVGAVHQRLEQGDVARKQILMLGGKVALLQVGYAGHWRHSEASMGFAVTRRGLQ